jgi:hypothetical protein
MRRGGRARLKALDSKSSLPERVTWVQIPPSPPPFLLLTCLGNKRPLVLFWRSVLRAELKEHIERIQGEFPGTVIASGPAASLRWDLDQQQANLPCAATISALSHSLASLKIATTDSNHGHKVYPNLLSGRQLTSINQAWVARHHLYLNPLGFVYLAVLLDRYSHKVIGWAISRRIDAELCSGFGVTPLLKYSF